MIPWGRPKAKREPVDSSEQARWSRRDGSLDAVPESAPMSERESSRLRDDHELTESARWRRYHESNQWGR